MKLVIVGLAVVGLAMVIAAVAIPGDDPLLAAPGGFCIGSAAVFATGWRSF